MTTKVPARGRPREFDLEVALTAGQRLFHAHGYEAVGIAALTEELGIKPPSFYKAFGSKAAYFERILSRYSDSVLPLGEILRPGRSVREVLSDLLEQAARTYGEDAQLRGCLVLECARGSAEDESVILARRKAEVRRRQVRRFVARENRLAAKEVSDYVATVMSGLSASAREGMSVARLVAVARAASPGIGLLMAVGTKS